MELVEGALFVHNDRNSTSAGIAVAIDLGLHIIRRDFGVGIANRVTQRLVAAPARNRLQQQHAERPAQDDLNSIATGCEWTLGNLLKVQSTVEMMAKVANLET